MDKATVKQLLLEVLSEALGDSTEALGFHSESTANGRYVFVNRSKGDCMWYEWDADNNKHLPITHNKLTGKITAISFRETQFRGKTDTKFVLIFDCGVKGNVTLESSLKTVYSRTLLLTLSQMPLEAYTNRITLELVEGTTDTVIFPSIYVDGQRLKVETPENFDESYDLRDIVGSIQMKLAGVSDEDESEDF